MFRAFPVRSRARFLALPLLMSVLATLPAVAQQMRTVSGDSALILREIGAVCQWEDDGLRVTTAFPSEGRPEAYRDVDVRSGDRVIAMNGAVVRDLDAARDLYDSAEPGTEIALGIDRDGRTRIVRFAKADPTTLPERMVFHGGDSGGARTTMMMRTEAGGSSPEMLPVPGLGVVLGAGEEGPEVTMVLPGIETALREGDRLLEVDGSPVDSGSAVADAVEAIEAGGEVLLVVEREGERHELRQTRSAARVRIQHGAGG